MFDSDFPNSPSPGQLWQAYDRPWTIQGGGDDQKMALVRALLRRQAQQQQQQPLTHPLQAVGDVAQTGLQAYLQANPNAISEATAWWKGVL